VLSKRDPRTHGHVPGVRVTARRPRTEASTARPDDRMVLIEAIADGDADFAREGVNAWVRCES
jgi:hypothetical protein